MSIFSGRSAQEPQEFWKSLEESLGTPIWGHALGRYLTGNDSAGPLWGLLYVTDKTFFFHHFAQANWFSAAIDHGMPRTSGTAGGVTIEVDLHRLHILEGHEVRGWRTWIRGADRNRYRLVDQSGARPPFEFTVEQRESTLVRELQRILEEKRSGGERG